MIAVETPPDVQTMLQDLQILPQLLVQTINVRHHGLVTDGLDRLIAIHWFSDDLGLLVEASIIEKRYEEHHTWFSRLRFAIADWIAATLSSSPTNSTVCRRIVRMLRKVRQSIRIHKVKVGLAVWVQPTIPGGTIGRNTPLLSVIEIVARSFGNTICCYEGAAPAYVYSGPWDGKSPRILGGGAEEDCFIAGSCYPDSSTCELVWALNFSRYSEWYRNTAAARVKQMFSITANDVVRAQQKVLEDALGIEWLRTSLQRESNHPAIERWKVCDAFQQRDGNVKVPSELGLAHVLLETMADNQALVECSAGDRHRFSFGSLANYGDPHVLGRLRKVLLHETQFGDALLELSCAAWLQAKGHDVLATEAEGMPDLRITIPGWKGPVFADCKRVSVKSARVIERVVSKANEQLRIAGVDKDSHDAMGIIYMDISARIGVLERSVGDAIPAAVQESADLVLRRLVHHNRSVSAVVLLWRERVTMSTHHTPPSVWLLLIWRNVIIRHKKPHCDLPVDDGGIAVQMSTGMQVVQTSEQQQQVLKQALREHRIE